MDYLQIKKVTGREILDSRGNPTVEAEVTLADGTVCRGAAPSGASTGEFEALELRDGDKSRYLGKGVTKAVKNINTTIREAITGLDASSTYAVDRAMIEADGTKTNRSSGQRHPGRPPSARRRRPPLLLTSRFTASGRHLRQSPAGSDDEHSERRRARLQYRGCAGVYDYARRRPQLREGLRWCTEVFHALAAILKSENLATSVGDVGGFAPNLAGDEEAISYILKAVEKAGYEPGKDFMLAMDAASSEWKGKKKGEYVLPKAERVSPPRRLSLTGNSLQKSIPLSPLKTLWTRKTGKAGSFSRRSWETRFSS